MQGPDIYDAQRAGRTEATVLLGAALAAVLVLYGIGLVALGTPPGAADTGEQVVAWFREHRNGVHWFVGTVHRERCHRSPSCLRCYIVCCQHHIAMSSSSVRLCS